MSELLILIASSLISHCSPWVVAWQCSRRWNLHSMVRPPARRMLHDGEGDHLRIARPRRTAVPLVFMHDKINLASLVALSLATNSGNENSGSNRSREDVAPSCRSLPVHRRVQHIVIGGERLAVMMIDWHHDLDLKQA